MLAYYSKNCKGGSIVIDVPAFVMSCSLVRPGALLSTRRIPAAPPHSQKTPVSPGAGCGPEPLPHGRVSRFHSRWVSSCVAWNHPVRTVPRQTDSLGIAVWSNPASNGLLMTSDHLRDWELFPIVSLLVLLHATCFP